MKKDKIKYNCLTGIILIIFNISMKFLIYGNTAIWLKKDDNVEEIINNLLSDSSKLEEMSNNAKSISKPNSTNDICKILLNN